MACRADRGRDEEAVHSAELGNTFTRKRRAQRLRHPGHAVLGPRPFHKRHRKVVPRD